MRFTNDHERHKYFRPAALYVRLIFTSPTSLNIARYEYAPHPDLYEASQSILISSMTPAAVTPLHKTVYLYPVPLIQAPRRAPPIHLTRRHTYPVYPRNRQLGVISASANKKLVSPSVCLAFALAPSLRKILPVKSITTARA